MQFRKKLVGAFVVVAVLSAAGVAGALVNRVVIRGSGPDAARVVCPGGMIRMGHEINENMSIFPGDPAFTSEIVYTVAEDFFLVEGLGLGTHAGTHLDAPKHFVEGARGVDDLDADEFVWPLYKIDVDELHIGADGLVERSDIREYEREFGRIRPGSMVVLRTGAEEFFGLDGPGDQRIVDADGLAANIDDLFDFENAGFSGDAVQWLFDRRDIAGVGSDAYGPDAFSDGDFLATFTALDNDGVSLVGLKNLDQMSVRRDVIMAPTVPLSDGSAFLTDPIGCLGASDDDDDDDGHDHDHDDHDHDDHDDHDDGTTTTTTTTIAPTIAPTTASP